MYIYAADPTEFNGALRLSITTSPPLIGLTVVVVVGVAIAMVVILRLVSIICLSLTRQMSTQPLIHGVDCTTSVGKDCRGGTTSKYHNCAWNGSRQREDGCREQYELHQEDR